jgi:hypothetical protein
MAAGGVGEAMLIGAAVGATAGGAGAAIQGGDPLQGALTGGALGAVGGGLGGAAGGAGALSGSGAGAASGAGTGAAAGTTAGTTAGVGAGTTAGSGFGLTAGSGAGSTIGAASGTGAGISGVGAGSGTLGSSGFGLTASSGLPTTASGIYGAGAGAGTTGAGYGIAAPTTSASLGGGAGGAGGGGAATNVFGQVAGTPGYLSNTALGMTAGTAGLAGAMQAERGQFGTPPTDEYDGPLSKLKYDPDRFTASEPQYAPTSVYRPTYAAEGGIMKLADGGMASAGNYGYPMNKNPDPIPNLETRYGMAEGGIARYDMGGMIPPSLGIAAAQQGTPQNNQQSYGEGIDALIGNKKRMLTKEQMDAVPLQGMSKGALKDIYGEMASQNLAKGGHLGGYSDGGRMLKGPGDGMSDSIPGVIANKQPARLADGEFVVPADVVSHLGNGSTDAGAKQLYAMMNRVRKARTGNPKQGKQIKPAKYMAA